MIASTCGEEDRGRNSPLHSITPDIHRGHDHANLGGIHHNYTRMMRLAKIDFLRFDGEKVDDWLSLAEEFFVIDHTPEESKVAIASLHFDGVAKA